VSNAVGASLDEIYVTGIGRTPLLTVTPKNVRYPPSFSSSTSRAGEPLTDTMPLTARSQTTRLMPGRFDSSRSIRVSRTKATVLEHHNQTLDQTKPLLMNLNFLDRFLGSRVLGRVERSNLRSICS
jgi:hypothetical protein